MLNIIINVVVRLISFATTLGLTYLSGKYMLLGVSAERGYTAVGGEVFLLAFIFVCIYFTCSRCLLQIVEAAIDDILNNEY